MEETSGLQWRNVKWWEVGNEVTEGAKAAAAVGLCGREEAMTMVPLEEVELRLRRYLALKRRRHRRLGRNAPRRWWVV